MPTVSVGRDRLFQALGRTYTEEEFEDLCFKFGIELDDVTTEKAIIRKEKHLAEEVSSEDEEVIYKIEVPANRYDLLCLEGLAQALRIFNGLDPIPTYNVANISSESMLKMHVKTEALPPPEINFIPLKQTKNFRADELMEFYKSDMKLKKFLHIIENSPVFPVIYDHSRTVLSLPPIINGAQSAISLETKNVFIECTATDLTKANIVLNTMVTMFSVYCERKFEVEPVEVIYPDGKSYTCPDLSLYQMVVPLSYITSAVGVSLPAEKVAGLLNKMQLHAEHSVSKEKQTIFTISVPPTRSDILHPCDVAEDVAIAYGYNEIPKMKLPSLKPQSLNQFSDLIRTEIAMVGYTEVLTWILCSYKENFSMLNRKDDKATAAINGNPRSADFEVVRTSLMPGILKTVGHNKDHPKPIKIFEVGDVVLLNETKDVGASNRRYLAALYCGSTSGFELIHGLVDRIMEVIGTPFVIPGDKTGYYIQSSEEPEFLPGRQATVIYKGKQIGTFGIVHPQVLDNFDIPDPCSFVELDIESFL
ncbi:phenylalanine--tRNA ligase beta subunit, cytoplasmic-like isoform X3 [Henckelia pumila]|uniref:phenylalanine--tRNA ligase beta subunit, cytoplasmic-like isoform X3 n=1 Tax=Henckelia pumila TaxID=405737 RepID=UPI003C6E734C